MPEHPVRLTVTDDLKRSRLTVFLRLLLAIPHFVWWWLWSIAAFFAAVALWFVTLIKGRPPAGLYTFLSSYVRYSIHLGAYLFLAANPYPMFTGRPGYPVDVEFDGPKAQRRWVTGFRLILAIPALTLAVVFQGGGFAAWFGDAETTATWAGGTLLVAAFLGWFVSVILGRMPQGLRDLQAYGLRYLAEAAAYALVLTERYPNIDPAGTPATGREHPVWLVIDDDLRRSRLTVFFRLFLSLPHFVWLLLWSIAAIFAVLLTWIAALVVGRPPQAFHRFLSAYLRYGTHVYAYAALTANPFPGFTGRFGYYPVDLRLPPADRQRRLVTLFRLFLAIPAIMVSGTLGGLIFLGALFGWFVSLALGRMPHSLREAQAYALRYSAQLSAYLFLVTARYPYSGPIRVPARS